MTCSPNAHRTRFLFLPALALLCLTAAAGAAEQRVARLGRWLTPEEAAALPAPPASRAEPSWGIVDTSTYTLGACEATFRSASLPAQITNCEIAKATLSGAVAPLAFPVHLPNGALVEAITMNYYDTNPGVEASGALYRISGTGVLEVLLSMEPAPTTGGNTSVTFIPDVPIQIDNDGASYAVLAVVHTASDTEYDAIYNFSIEYRLQVSPDPATATFGDVPVGHVFHRYVEALAASGITAGCGSGNFCPDAALTRGQMAAFLSIALGLHFPD